MNRIKSLLKRVLPPRVWTWLRILHLRWIVLRYRKRVVTHTYGGRRLSVCLADPLAAGWYDHDWPVLREIGVLRRHGLHPGSLVFDLGAHQGIVALMLAGEVGNQGRVIAVEAHPHNAEAARRNCTLNGAVNVVVLNAAVTDRCGAIVVSRSLNADVDSSGSWGRQRVPALTVDELCRRYGWPQVVYIDIEGHEVAALRAAAGAIGRDADWLIEVHTRLLARYGGTVHDVISAFPPERYERLTAPEDGGAFGPLDIVRDVSLERFYLLALSRAREAVNRNS